MLQLGEDSPHIWRRIDLFFGVPRSIRPGCPIDRGLGSRSDTGGRSLCKVTPNWWFWKSRVHGKLRLLDGDCPRGVGGCFQHQALRRRRLVCPGLSLTGSRLPLETTPPDRSSGTILCAGPIGAPAGWGLTPSGSFRFGGLPPWLRGAGPLWLPSGASSSGPLPWLYNRWWIAHNLHLSYRLV